LKPGLLPVPSLARGQDQDSQVSPEDMVDPPRVVPASDLRQRERSLGKGLEDQYRRPAGSDQCLDDRACRVGPVTGKAGGTADAKNVATPCAIDRLPGCCLHGLFSLAGRAVP
jgi:hypothetical protein